MSSDMLVWRGSAKFGRSLSVLPLTVTVIQSENFLDRNQISPKMGLRSAARHSFGCSPNIELIYRSKVLFESNSHLIFEMLQFSAKTCSIFVQKRKNLR